VNKFVGNQQQSRKGTGEGGSLSAYYALYPETHEFKGHSTCNCNAKWQSGVVLDPFFGAGTTAIAASALGRSWVGIELSKEYIQIAKQRLVQHGISPTPRRARTVYLGAACRPAHRAMGCLPHSAGFSSGETQKVQRLSLGEYPPSRDAGGIFAAPLVQGVIVVADAAYASRDNLKAIQARDSVEYLCAQATLRLGDWCATDQTYHSATNT
jgi:hypothetical protein